MRVALSVAVCNIPVYTRSFFSSPRGVFFSEREDVSVFSSLWLVYSVDYSGTYFMWVYFQVGR